MATIQDSRLQHLAAVAALAAAVLIAYSNTFHIDFQFDGVPLIKENPSIRDLGNLHALLVGARPVTMITFALNYAAGGLDPFGYHVVNAAIHIANSVLAYLLVMVTLGAYCAEGAWTRRVAFFSALLFAVHPVQTQAVTYIIQRMESLASLFYLSGLLFFIVASRGQAAGRGPAKTLLYYGAAVAAYVLAFYSKEIAVTLPLAIILYDLFFTSGLAPARLVKRLPFHAVMVALMVLFTVLTLGSAAGGFSDMSEESFVGGAKSAALSASEKAPAGPAAAPSTPGAVEKAKKRPSAKGASVGFNVESITPTEYLLTQFNVITYYLALLVYPANQNLDYHFPVATSLFRTPVAAPGTVLNIPPLPPVVSLVVIVLIFWASVRLALRSRRDPGAHPVAVPVSFFILWFFVILSPTSSFVPITDVIFEHRLYLASLGFFTVAVLLVDTLAARLLSGGRAAGELRAPR